MNHSKSKVISLTSAISLQFYFRMKRNVYFEVSDCDCKSSG